MNQLVVILKNFTFRSKKEKENKYWKMWFIAQEKTIKK